jgi:hypothetical protein
MSIEYSATLRPSPDVDIGEQRRDAQPAVIALVDRRGRRCLVPVHAGLKRPVSRGSSTMHPTLRLDASLTIGTIH